MYYIIDKMQIILYHLLKSFVFFMKFTNRFKTYFVNYF